MAAADQLISAAAAAAALFLMVSLVTSSSEGYERAMELDFTMASLLDRATHLRFALAGLFFGVGFGAVTTGVVAVVWDLVTMGS